MLFSILSGGVVGLAFGLALIVAAGCTAHLREEKWEAALHRDFPIGSAHRLTTYGDVVVSAHYPALKKVDVIRQADGKRLHLPVRLVRSMREA